MSRRHDNTAPPGVKGKKERHTPNLNLGFTFYVYFNISDEKRRKIFRLFFQIFLCDSVSLCFCGNNYTYLECGNKGEPIVDVCAGSPPVDVVFNVAAVSGWRKFRL